MMNAHSIVSVLLGEAYQDDWVPSPSDVAWTQQLFNSLRNGGVWVTSEGAFKIDKENKTLLFAGLRGQMFSRVAKCAERLGYTVRHIGDNPDEQAFSA
jgi:hypothetical protein